MPSKDDNNFTPSHERANALSHGIGALIAICLIPVFCLKFEEIKVLHFSIALYFFSILFMLFSSTAYHAVKKQSLKPKLRVLDHIAIFFVIGATTLPFVVQFANPEKARFFAISQWTLIGLGSLLKVFFTGRFRLFSSIIYTLIGAMVLTLGTDFWSSIPDFSFYAILAGGALYLIGVFFYQNRNIPYNHFIWHLFVLAALFVQAWGMYCMI